MLQVIETKNQQISIEERIEKVTANIEQTVKDQTTLRIEILSKRAGITEKMSKYSNESIILEEKVWIMDNKINAVEMQNKHFEDAIAELDRKQSEMLETINNSESDKKSLIEEIEQCQQFLHSAWHEDKLLQEKYFQEDSLLLENLDNFSSVVEIRKDSLIQFYEDISRELNILNNSIKQFSNLAT